MLKTANMLDVTTYRSKYLKEVDSVNSKLVNVKVDTLSKDSCVESKVSIEGCKVIRTHNATVGKIINLSTDKLSNDKLDVTSSRSKCLKEVDLVNSKLVNNKWEKGVIIEENNVIRKNNYTGEKYINLSNDKLSNDGLNKLAANLFDSDYVVGIDNFRVISKSESDGKVVGEKLIFSRGWILI